ncbi:MAG: type I DNA topoisomerase [Paludibacteraceae bacterium]|nr:type I DNA topoisomerase [Paludibacteraceae bacterium]
MSKNLVIVESPAKAKTIEKFLGKDFRVLSSQGHIRDIEAIGKNSMGIDFQNGYAPNYVIDSQKENLVQALAVAAQKADKVWLASDEDREGEAIAWHLQQVLDLQPEKTHRIVFHEITKTAIQEAIQNPRGIDYNLVNAQQARRVMDRIVGFELSPVLWKKVTTGLSAGRVQSVVVRLVVEREREIEKFEVSSNYRLTAEFVGKSVTGEDVIFKTELNHRFASKEEAYAFLQQCQNQTFSVSSVTHKPGHRSPAPPFTTSSLQQEAVRKLHFSVSKTMRLAQSLYEAGHITYMRTDSVNLSSLAINTAKTEIISEFGENYHKARQYKTTAKGAQEAHEAIRPTYMNVEKAGANNDERRLYDLIRKRAIASQMADAETDTTRVEVAMSDSPYLWVANYSVITFDGFMRVYTQSSDDELSAQLSTLNSQLSIGVCTLSIATAQESFTKPPLRYDEGSLVEKMKDLGIGRPSTYATVIETIQSRGYVERGNVEGTSREYNVLTLSKNKIKDTTKTDNVGAETSRLLPTDLGRITNDFLVDQFPAILSYDFTAREEENFDAIAAGEAEWVKTVDNFYHTFHPLIQQVPSGKMAARELGVDPASGEPIFARISKNGPCVQLGNSDTEKPRFVSMPKGMSLFTITLEDALSLFQNALPLTLGEYQGQEVVIGEGKYGPYIRYNGAFTSLPKGTDPYSVTLEHAIQLLTQKQQQELPIHTFGDILVLNGRYGAYIKTPQGNYKLPRGVEADSLTEQICQEIIAKSEPTNATKRKFKK